MSKDFKFDSIKIEKDFGTYHPITITLSEISNILVDFGFNEISGPEIESEKFNFDMLNISEHHPARQMHDTFYVNNKFFRIIAVNCIHN